MEKLKNFLKTSLLGGVVVILPVAILVSVTLWIFDLVTGLIEPLTRLLISDSQLNEKAAEILVIILIVMTCFFVGVLVRTQLGGFLYRFLETRILKLAPGYSMIKETVLQIFGSRKDSPFSSVALVQVFGNDNPDDRVRHGQARGRQLYRIRADRTQSDLGPDLSPGRPVCAPGRHSGAGCHALDHQLRRRIGATDAGFHCEPAVA